MIPRQDGDRLINGLPRSDPRPPSDDETDLEYRVLGLQIWETPEWEESSPPESEDQGTLDSTLLRGGRQPTNRTGDYRGGDDSEPILRVANHRKASLTRRNLS